MQLRRGGAGRGAAMASTAEIRLDATPTPLEGAALRSIASELRGPVAPDATSLRGAWPPGLSFRERVARVLGSGHWYTVAGIANRVGCRETGAAARLRELRRHGVEVETRRARCNGRWYYRAPRGNGHG